MFHKTHVGVKCKQVPSLLEIKQFILVSYLLVLMLDFLLNSVDVLIWCEAKLEKLLSSWCF